MKKPTGRRPEKPFSVYLFALTIILTLALYMALFSIIAISFAPDIWKSFTETHYSKFIIVIFGGHLVCSFAEFLFHRYMLHMSFPFPYIKVLKHFFERLHKQHTLHHNLTSVKMISVIDGRGRIFNRYPILEERQHEASYFPWYSLAIFLCVSMIVVVPLQILLPNWPVAVGAALAIALSLSLYEIVHMVEHLPFESFWKPKVTSHRFGKLWTSFYCFHLRHHADVSSNENISGFFGFPLADVFFGTYAPWPYAFEHGDIVPCGQFEARPPRPRLIIRLLDRMLVKEEE